MAGVSRTVTAAVVSGLLALVAIPGTAQMPSVNPASMPRVGTVHELFHSYNVEMVEVTGGRFWKPYASTQAPAAQPAPPPEGAKADPMAALFEYRPPVNLGDQRLVALATALGPAYVRVSGTWANSVFFHDADGPAPDKPPQGFNSVLTRPQWKAVVNFVRATGGKLMTSFAWSAGTRDAAGLWTPAQARQLVAFTKAAGGAIDAAEFVNEPNYAANGAAPAGYDGAAFARDLAVFRDFFRKDVPGGVLLGPGSAGEGGVLDSAQVAGRITSADLLKPGSTGIDAFSYHIYTAVSQRCARGVPALGTTADAALTQEWLFRADRIHNFYEGLRDRFEPGKPLWVTEMADAACGGNPWASTFLDSFRYLNVYGRLARQGVQVVAHNTLAASDYGLIDETTHAPRPNYWAALLWKRLMGTGVLEPGGMPVKDLYTYAHCMQGRPGGVTLLAINAGPAAATFDVAAAGERFTLTADELQSRSVRLNGEILQAGSGGSVPPLTGRPVAKGPLSLPPTSITFVTFPGAANRACR
jgi:heparanase 1